MIYLSIISVNYNYRALGMPKTQPEKMQLSGIEHGVFPSFYHYHSLTVGLYSAIPKVLPLGISSLNSSVLHFVNLSLYVHVLTFTLYVFMYIHLFKVNFRTKLCLCLSFQLPSFPLSFIPFGYSSKKPCSAHHLGTTIWNHEMPGVEAKFAH